MTEADPEVSDGPYEDVPPRPALKALLHDQRALVNVKESDYADYALREGFPSRRRVIEWYQRAVVRTFGYITDAFPPADLVRDETLLDALVGADRLDRRACTQYRARVEADILQPACTQAYQDLRGGATEYIFDDNEDGPRPTDLIPDEQAHLAMRPSFQHLDREQRDYLERLWGGFEDVDELLDWTHGLNSPTNGELRASFTEELTNDPAAMDYLIRERKTRAAREFRVQLAVQDLLPAFADGIESTNPGELAQRKQTTAQTFEFK